MDLLQNIGIFFAFLSLCRYSTFFLQTNFVGGAVMYKTTIFAEGIASVQKYLSERGNSDGIFEKYLYACKSLETFYSLENMQRYEPDANERYRVHIDALVKKGEISERQGRHYRRFSLMMGDFP